MKIYEISYWDPCNGMGGRSQHIAFYQDKDEAQAIVDEKNAPPSWGGYSILEHDIVPAKTQAMAAPKPPAPGPEAGRVAHVNHPHGVYLNRGQRNGVTIGSVYRIGRPVIDPETGQEIGQFPAVLVKVVEVEEKFCKAETYRLRPGDEKPIVVRIGDEARLRLHDE